MIQLFRLGSLRTREQQLLCAFECLSHEKESKGGEKRKKRRGQRQPKSKRQKEFPSKRDCLRFDRQPSWIEKDGDAVERKRRKNKEKHEDE